MAVGDLQRIDEDACLEELEVFQPATVTAKPGLIEDGHGADELTEANASAMGADRHAELGCDGDDGKEFVDASNPGAVDLAMG